MLSHVDPQRLAAREVRAWQTMKHKKGNEVVSVRYPERERDPAREKGEWRALEDTN